MTISNASSIVSSAVLAYDRNPLDSPYNYIPTQSTAIIFLVFFGLSTAIHTGQAFYYRLWWLLPTAILAGLLELVGWSARLWSSVNPPNENAFEMQIVATIIAPTPLVAANFVILGLVINRLGSCYSRISPKWYTIIFCSFDIISLVIQGVGGGIAASADTNDEAARGAHIMLGGICFQTVTITLYALLAGEFLTRYSKDKPVRVPEKSTDSDSGPFVKGSMSLKTRIMIAALIFNTLCLFIRSIYRIAELADGWNGRIISTQVYFVVLDGVMVLLAMYTLNFAHPGLLLGHRRLGQVNTNTAIPMRTTASNGTLV